LEMLRRIEKPVVMETHGGIGKLYASCYSTIRDGVVFERDPKKADFLAQQRPAWSVYRVDVDRALEAGAGAHLVISLLDLDPDGSPWVTAKAFFSSKRDFAPMMGIVANDGLRQALQLRRGWATTGLEDVTAKYGNDVLFRRYKEICRELLEEIVSRQRYRVSAWAAYYTGSGAGTMTHWAAVLQRDSNK
jgi:hypothetical protein